MIYCGDKGQNIYGSWLRATDGSRLRVNGSRLIVQD